MDATVNYNNDGSEGVTFTWDLIHKQVTYNSNKNIMILINKLLLFCKPTSCIVLILVHETTLSILKPKIK